MLTPSGSCVLVTCLQRVHSTDVVLSVLGKTGRHAKNIVDGH